jgi:AAA15 family ATPase/GTPase
MIIRFRVRNYRSILNEQEVSFVAYNQRENPESLLQTETSAGALLRAIALYGANASGKSNLLSSLWFLRSAVRNSQRKWDSEGIPVPQFAGERGQHANSKFVLDFIVNGTRFEYGFETSRHEITSEWLYGFPTNRKQLWFSRTGGSVYKFGKALMTGDDRKKSSAIPSLVRKNSLFLSAAIQNNFASLRPMYDAIVENTIFVNDDRQNVALTTAQRTIEDPAMRNEIAPLLRAADLGLVGYEVEEEAMTESQQQIFQAILSAVPEEKRPKDMIDYKFPKVEFVHEAAGGESFRFTVKDESDGTVAYFGLLGPITTALRSGGLLVIDELETSLHPLLAQSLVNLFGSPVTNPKGAQLLFSTHSPSMLGSDILRRDQIWLSRKTKESETEIFPLSDFKARKGERVDKGYLQGRFGAIPFIDVEVMQQSFAKLNDLRATESDEVEQDVVLP